VDDAVVGARDDAVQAELAHPVARQVRDGERDAGLRAQLAPQRRDDETHRQRSPERVHEAEQHDDREPSDDQAAAASGARASSRPEPGLAPPSPRASLSVGNR
jgi:hypothetical protein